MRITNNLSLNVLVDRTALIESKGNNLVSPKLMDLLKQSPNNQLKMEAVLQSVQEGTGKFWIKDLGTVEVALDTSVKLPEQSKLTVTFTITDGQISAELAPIEDAETALPEKIKTSEQILRQLKLPETPQNIKSLELLTEYHIEPSAERIKQLAEGSFLASKIKENSGNENFISQLVTEDQEVDWTKTLKAVVVDWLGKTSNPLPKDNVLGVNISSSDKAIVPDQKVVDAVANETAIELGESELDSESQKIPVKGTPVEQLKALLQTINPKTLLPLIASNLTLNLDNLNRSEQVFNGGKTIALLKQALFDRMADVFSKLDPSSELKKDVLIWLEEESSDLVLCKQLESLEQIISKHSPEAANELKENFEQINKSMTLLEQLPSELMAFHLPIKLGDFDTQVEFYMKKKKSRNSQDDFKVLLALNTNTMGQVQVLVTDQKQLIEIQFRLESEQVKEVFEAEEAVLKASLDPYAVKNVKLTFGCHFKEPAILEAFKELGQEHTSSIDVRV